MRNAPIDVKTNAAAARNTRALMQAVAQIAPCSGWLFATFGEDGDVDELASNVIQMGHARQVEILTSERSAQSTMSQPFPRISAARVPVGPYRGGLTLAFGKRRTISGMMMLLRSSHEIEFSDAELEALKSSLEPIAQAVAESGDMIDETDAHLRLTQRIPPAQYVLRRDFTLEYYYEPQGKAFHFVDEASGQLSEQLLAAVRGLVTDWTEDPQSWKERTAMPMPLVALRSFPLLSADGVRIGLSIERFGARNSLAWAAQRFSISARELQVLALILQGMGTPEIASRLQIAESTAHDHIKRMLLKTKARNRAEMVAKTLGWRIE